jgi:hypothetical protein
LGIEEKGGELVEAFPRCIETVAGLQDEKGIDLIFEIIEGEKVVVFTVKTAWR